MEHVVDEVVPAPVSASSPQPATHDDQSGNIELPTIRRVRNGPITLAGIPMGDIPWHRVPSTSLAGRRASI